MSKSDIAVSVRGLSKAYTIAHDQEKQITLAETMLARLKNPLKRAKTETFWALKDINFDIKKGDVVGIIGRNGAGKSTLLKILSRITEPTTGRIDLYGRVGSLLEVGTGFHPELTGRENVFLNGAILGMSKAEIRAQFEAIVSFAGVEQFLDTPVKRYSSGMYVRLAFAVAAHLNPEILIVDEVLAVGDVEFQRKCLGKMKDVAGQGRTVLFVSHNMSAVSLLCTNCTYLKNGRIESSGAPHEVLSHYLSAGEAAASSEENYTRRPGTGNYRFSFVTPMNEFYHPTEMKTIRFGIIRTGERVAKMYLSGILVNQLGSNVAQFDSRLLGIWISDHDLIEGTLSITLPWLLPGKYTFDAYICTPEIIVDRLDGACTILVSGILPYPSSAGDDSLQFATVLSDFTWQVSSNQRADDTKLNLIEC